MFFPLSHLKSKAKADRWARQFKTPTNGSIEYACNRRRRHPARTRLDLSIPQHIRDWLDSQGIAYDSGRLRAHIYFLNDDQRALFKLKFQ